MLSLLALACPLAAEPEECEPTWIPTFGEAPGLTQAVYATAVFDDGSGGGPALYVGGTFSAAGGQAANRIAKWDGESWSALSTGMDDAVLALAVFDDGTGPALYAGGQFTTAGGVPANHIARWDGKTWSALGTGVNASVRALTVFDDGTGGGPALYAGGGFVTAGGQGAKRIAKWDGASWSPLGSGIGDGADTTVLSLAVFDDGSGGPALYAGGNFDTAGGVSARCIARWDGAAWSSLGSGMNSIVYALAVFDDGTGGGPALYAGGQFTTAGPVFAICAAKWSGGSWSAVSGGMNNVVTALHVFDDGSGSGPALYAGGLFTSAGGQAANHAGKWDGTSWSALGSGVSNDVYAFAGFDDGSGAGSKLFVGGSFLSAGNRPAYHIASWSGGGGWDVLGNGLTAQVHALASFDDGSGAGAELYAGGYFTMAAGASVPYAGKWNGASWNAPGGGMNDAVLAFAVFDDGAGGGPALFAGGKFTSAGGVPASRIAKWDGQGWSPLGSGISGSVHALAVFDDGTGPALYAGGEFTTAGGVSANHIAKWDGRSWTALASGMSANDAVFALAVFDDGAGGGPALYAGGSFDTAGGVDAGRVARWDGASWSALGSGIELSDGVHALAVFDDGSGAGPALYAGGSFAIAGGEPMDNIAKWDGASWSAVGSGSASEIRALTTFDGGSSGPALYAASGIPANNVAKWDGRAWSDLASGMDFIVYALGVHDDGSGTGAALYAGGWFATSAAGDSYVAKWGCPAIDDVPGCSGNPAELAALASEAEIGSVFTVSLASELASGLGALFLGHDGTDAAGCGFFVPGIGELLLGLAPLPAQVASSFLTAGAALFALPVPDDLGLVGVHVALQGAVLSLFDPGTPVELSNALRVTITQ